MTDAIPYTVPAEPGRWPAIILAVLVHAALFTFLWFGVRWQNETPMTIEAEVWSPQPREAAPQPIPEPESKPVNKEMPKPASVEPPITKPDINLEQEKKRKEEEKRIEKEKTENAKKAATEQQRKKDEAEAKLLEKARDEEMRRITGGVTGAGGTGEAAKAQGGRADSSYMQRVGAKIKSNTIFNIPIDLPGNPAVEYAVDLLPDGSVRGIRKLKSSGLPEFDEAVRRAIEKSQPYPPDKSGIAPSGFTMAHKPKDQ